MANTNADLIRDLIDIERAVESLTELVNAKDREIERLRAFVEKHFVDEPHGFGCKPRITSECVCGKDEALALLKPAEREGVQSA